MNSTSTAREVSSSHSRLFCRAMRFVISIRRFVQSELGWKRWTNIVGLRADEKSRVTNALERAKLKKDPWDITFLKREIVRRGGLPANWTGISAKQVDALTHRR